MRTTPPEPQDSAIDPDTLRAYRLTHYRVEGDPPFTLRVGAPSAALAALHSAHQAGGSAFITACNPLGQRLGDADNGRRQQALAAELEECGYAVLPGLGCDPTGAWQAEPSFLVLDASLEAARDLGRQFQQNAVLWSGPDAIPQLVLLR